MIYDPAIGMGMIGMGMIGMVMMAMGMILGGYVSLDRLQLGDLPLDHFIYAFRIVRSV